MSRSYKKVPVCKDKESRVKRRNKAKTIANRAVRRKEVPGGRAGYKKLYCSWDISDWRFLGSEKQLRQEWENEDLYLRKRYRDYKQALSAWKKLYIRK